MKKALIIFLGSLLLFGCNNSNSSNRHMRSNQNMQRGMNHNMHQDMNENMDCSHLSQKEKNFANKLSNMHKAIFCKIFSAQQRQQAIKIYEDSSTLEGRGRSAINIPIPPDIAVEKVIKDSRRSYSDVDTARAYYNLH